MKINLVAVGTKMPDWVDTGVAEYQKRLPRSFELVVTEIPLARRSKANPDIDRLRDKEGKAGIRFFVCSLDDSIWLSEGEAIRHVLKAHFDTFYQVEKTPCDPPKGVWTLVAQFDEIILGPPN